VLTLLSPRLTLRKLTVADATPAYAAWLNDPEVNRYLETRHSPQTVESCREFIMQMNASDTQHLFGMFLVTTGEHIGNIKVGFVDQRHQSAQVSLFIGEKSKWGKGYATEAIDVVSSHAFFNLGLQRLEAGVYEGNYGSLQSFLKLGYSVEGFFRGRYVLDGRRVGSFGLGVLKTEWRHENA
jgi:ribosomal-protein-alanine N-acetyltransferase